MQKILVFADPDESYLRRFVQTFRERSGLSYGIMIITGEEYLISYLSTHTVYWLFVSQSLLSDQVRLFVRDSVTVLSEETDDSSAFSLFKYQTADRLVEGVLSVLPGRAAVRRKEMIVVYPSDGGFSSELFSLSIARFLAEYGSVYYFNLDCFSPVRSYFPEEGKSLSDYLFRYRNGTFSSLQGENFAMKDAFHFLSPPVTPEDCDDLKGIDLTDFFFGMVDDRDCDWIVLKLSENPVFALELLDAAKILYLPSGNDFWHERRREELSSYLFEAYGPDCAKKIGRTDLPAVSLTELTEKSFDEIYENVWRDFVWGQLTKDRFI